MLTANHVSAQDIGDSEKSKIKRVSSLIKSAGNLFKEKDFTGSADKIRNAQKELVRLADGKNAAVVGELKKDYGRILKAQKLLEGKGETFDSMPSFKSFMAASSDSIGSDTENDSQLVSFTKEVAPILMQHCGKCHIEQMRGKYDMNTYTSIKKGTRKGAAIKPRDVKKSRLIGLIATGKMPPRSKGAVSKEQLEVLMNWVAQGAKFDGENKQKKAKLNTYVSTEGNDTKAGGIDSNEN